MPHGSKKYILQAERPLVFLSEKQKGMSCLNQVKPLNLELLFRQLLDEAEIDKMNEAKGLRGQALPYTFNSSYHMKANSIIDCFIIHSKYLRLKTSMLITLNLDHS